MIDVTQKYLPIFTLYLHGILDREVDRGYLIGKNGERMKIGVLTSEEKNPAEQFVYHPIMKGYDIVFVIYLINRTVWGYRLDDSIRVGGMMTKDYFFRTDIKINF